jgi:hypothetical protein
MKQSIGAQAAFRGYLAQTLYILHRILSDEDKCIFGPEMEEDLSIFDSNGNLLEVVQIKNYSNPLRLSDFGNDFFTRCRQYTKEKTPIKIVSFGELGPELRKSFGDKTDIQTIASKLTDKYGYSSEEVEGFFNLISVESVLENDIRKEVENLLKKNAFAMYQKEASFDFLTHFVFSASTQQNKISQEDVLKKLEQIVKFVNESHSFLKTFGNNVTEIFNNTILSDDELSKNKIKYQTEFYNGVSARPEHIRAEIDVVRKIKIQNLKQCFENNDIVIIHGASGQGKSSLAYRYLHDCHPISYEIKHCNVNNLFDILNTLKKLSQSLNQKIPIYIDVAPGDEGWLSIVRELQRYPNLFLVLIAIREEDWNNSSYYSYEISYADLELNFDENEAKKIFALIEEHRIIKEFPSFEDAWREFGEEGPLLEFIYLITQGITLRSRLNAQIFNNRYSDDHRNILRLIAFSGQYGSNVKIKSLFESINNLNDIEFKRIISFFENEHIIRKIDASHLTILHPIRAEIISSLLISEVTDIEKIAIICTKIIDEADYKKFLQNYFYYYPGKNKELIAHLEKNKYSTWSGITNVLNSLLWLGVQQYVETNRALIDRAYALFSNGWYLFGPGDLLDIEKEIYQNFANLLQEANPDNFKIYKEILKQYSDTSDALQIAKAFCSKCFLPDELGSITSRIELLSFSELLFWFGYFGLQRLKVKELLDKKSLLAHNSYDSSFLFLGSYHYSKSSFDYLLPIRDEVVNNFKKEYSIFLIEEHESSIKLHYLPANDINPTEEKSDVGNWHSMQRINILRRFFPEKETFEAEGYGFDPSYLGINFNSTIKKIQKKNLPIDWHRKINQYFIGLGAMPYRPSTWEEYFESIYNYLNEVSRYTGQLIESLKENQRKDIETVIKFFGMEFGTKKTIMFPALAVDKFGEMTENSEINNPVPNNQNTPNIKNSKDIIFFEEDNQKKERIFKAIMKHSKLKKSLSGFEKHFNNFVNWVQKIMIQKTKDITPNRTPIRLLLSNLQDASKHFDQLQEVWRNEYLKYLTKKSALPTNKLFTLYGLCETFFKNKKNRNIKDIKQKIKTCQQKVDISHIENKLKKLERQKYKIFAKRFGKKYFFLVDTDSLKKYTMILRLISKGIRNALGAHERITLNRTIFANYIDAFYIVPLYKSKILFEQQISKLELYSLFDIGPENRNPLYNIAHDVDIDFIKEKMAPNLSNWYETYPEIKYLNGCINDFNSFRCKINYLSKIPHLIPEIENDETGLEILSKHAELAINKGVDLQNFSNNLAAFGNEVSKKIELFMDGEQERCRALITTPLQNIISELLPPGSEMGEHKYSEAVNLSDFPLWAEKLNNSTESVLSKILTAISYLLSFYENDGLLKE